MNSAKRVWNSFLIAFSMYSKIPVPRADWEKENMKYVMCFFPAIGVVIGLLIWLWQKICVFLDFGSLMRSAGFVLIPILVSGGIHLDGFLDTMDALSSYQTKERKLEILKDSHAGAFAVIMGCVYFTLALGVWSEMSAAALPAVCVAFTASRALSALALTCFPCANKNGSLATFADAAQKRVVQATLGLWLLAAAGFSFFTDWRLALILIVTWAAVYAYYYHVAMSQFGGTTGDVAGFFLQVCELAAACTVMLGGKLL